jgi:nucleoside-diphosphate-sugar epimerase
LAWVGTPGGSGATEGKGDTEGAGDTEGKGDTEGLVIGITGATGHLGGLLLAKLLADPAVAKIRSVARRPLPPVADRLVHVQADLQDTAARRALEGVDLLYHLGAQVWRGRGQAGLERMYKVNVSGTRNVLDANPGAVVFASSASVYGAWPDNPLPLSEGYDARPNPECPYAQHKLLAERLCLDSAGDRCTILRVAAVLGPHADARVSRSLQGYRLTVPAVRGVVQAVQWADEADIVAGILAAGHSLVGGAEELGGGQGGGAGGQVINLAPVDWLSAGEMAGLAASRVISLPRGALITLSELGRCLGLAPFGADRAALISGPLALSPGKAGQLLGWAPSRTSAEVFADALGRGWRAQPRNRS